LLATLRYLFFATWPRNPRKLRDTYRLTIARHYMRKCDCRIYLFFVTIRFEIGCLLCLTCRIIKLDMCVFSSYALASFQSSDIVLLVFSQRSEYRNERQSFIARIPRLLFQCMYTIYILQPAVASIFGEVNHIAGECVFVILVTMDLSFYSFHSVNSASRRNFTQLNM